MLPNELVMCAVLNDFPVVQHQNLIGISYGFQTVSNHNDGLVMGQRLNILLRGISRQCEPVVKAVVGQLYSVLLVGLGPS